MNRQQDAFAEKNILTLLMKFAIPGVITILVAELYNMVDTFFLGMYVGPNAVGALGIAFPIQRLFIAVALMIGVGASTSVARALGEKNYKKVNESIGNAITLGLIVLTLLPMLIFLFRKQIFYGLGASDIIFPLVEEYINIILLGTLFLGLTNILGYCIISLGDPKVTVMALSIGALTNIVVDFILVARLGMGVKGAAIATFLSQIVGFAYASFKMWSYGKDIGLKIKPYFNMGVWGAILSIGFATFIVEISDAIVIALLNNMLLPYGGDTAVIIIGAITKISMFMYITVIGISAGMQPIASYNYGAGDYKKLKEVVSMTIKLASITCIALWAFMMIFANQIFGSFIKEADILTETVKAFRITVMIFPIISIYYVSIYYNQAINRAKVSFFLSIYRQLLLFIPIVIVLIKTMGTMGAWMTYPITDVISAITGMIFIKKALYTCKDCNNVI